MASLNCDAQHPEVLALPAGKAEKLVDNGIGRIPEIVAVVLEDEQLLDTIPLARNVGHYLMLQDWHCGPLLSRSGVTFWASRQWNAADPLSTPGAAVSVSGQRSEPQSAARSPPQL